MPPAPRSDLTPREIARAVRDIGRALVLLAPALGELASTLADNAERSGDEPMHERLASIRDDTALAMTELRRALLIVAPDLVRDIDEQLE